MNNRYRIAKQTGDGDWSPLGEVEAENALAAWRACPFVENGTYEHIVETTHLQVIWSTDTDKVKEAFRVKLIGRPPKRFVLVVEYPDQVVGVTEINVWISADDLDEAREYAVEYLADYHRCAAEDGDGMGGETWEFQHITAHLREKAVENEGV